MNAQVKDGCLVSVGALLGGLLGMAGFLWAVRQGFYALVLPGALAGLGAGLFRNHSKTLAVLCGLYGLVMGVIAEWRIAPFSADPGFGYFLTHVHQLRGLTIILIGVGAVIAFWVPFRRISEAKTH